MTGKPTSTLWVYAMEGEEKRPLREVTWVFEEDRDEGKECWVGVYAAKPKEKVDGDKNEEGLKVHFEELSIETF